VIFGKVVAQTSHSLFTNFAEILWQVQSTKAQLELKLPNCDGNNYGLISDASSSSSSRFLIDSNLILL
jgi:hypothetical protein